MPHSTTLYRQKLKMRNPEKYEEYLQRQRDAAAARRARESSEPQTKAKKIKLAARRERKRVSAAVIRARKRGEALTAGNVPDRSFYTLPISKRVNRKEMTAEELMAHKKHLRKKYLARWSEEKKRLQQEKRATYMRARRALNKVTRPKASSRAVEEETLHMLVIVDQPPPSPHVAGRLCRILVDASTMTDGESPRPGTPLEVPQMTSKTWRKSTKAKKSNTSAGTDVEIDSVIRNGFGNTRRLQIQPMEQDFAWSSGGHNHTLLKERVNDSFHDEGSSSSFKYSQHSEREGEEDVYVHSVCDRVTKEVDILSGCVSHSLKTEEENDGDVDCVLLDTDQLKKEVESEEESEEHRGTTYVIMNRIKQEVLDEDEDLGSNYENEDPGSDSVDFHKSIEKHSMPLNLQQPSRSSKRRISRRKRDGCDTGYHFGNSQHWSNRQSGDDGVACPPHSQHPFMGAVSKKGPPYVLLHRL